MLYVQADRSALSPQSRESRGDTRLTRLGRFTGAHVIPRRARQGYSVTFVHAVLSLRLCIAASPGKHLQGLHIGEKRRRGTYETC